MKNKALWICAAVLAGFLLLGALFYPIAGDSLHFVADTTETVSPHAPVGLVFKDGSIEQSFRSPFDMLTHVTVKPIIPNPDSTDEIRFEILDRNSGEVLYLTYFNVSTMQNNQDFTVPLVEKDVNNVKNRDLTLRLTSLSGDDQSAISFYCGNSIATGRIDVPMEVEESDGVHLNGLPVASEDGSVYSLYMTTQGVNYHWIGQYYWLIYAGAALLLALYLVRVLYCHKNGKKNLALFVVTSLCKYSFLVRQLVSRDFKTKYKRSVLGVFWSFLNPLLTMSIQYVVFSTLFKSTIPNFVIYLLCGIVCLNFFNESTSMCLSSIVGNATLINKVYVPKYIYPFSRSLSSTVNLLLSLVPLLIMLLVTGTPLRPAALLLPYALLMLFMLSYGVGLILATMMVFFRDTQFLWGIFTMLLTYLTPVFYPESIIPDKFMTAYKINPLYHVIRFVRGIFIDGVSPEPKAYLLCFIVCFIPFLIGVTVFRRNQDKFILNI